MNETQDTISEWAVKTFGPAGTVSSVTVRAMKELVELMGELANPGDVDHHRVCDECADVVIVLTRAAKRLGYDIFTEMEAERRFINHEQSSIMHVIVAMDRMNALLRQCTRERRIAPGDERWLLGSIAAELEEVCTRHGGSLRTCIDAKMAINRGRVWRLDGRGHGQHVDVAASNG